MFPGQPAFEHFTGGRRDCDRVYVSKLCVNYDPGRNWKLVGSILIVAGIVITYYVRLGRGAGRKSLAAALCLAAVICTGCGDWTEGHDRLDWSRWRRLPTLGEGRSEPLDSFARKTVEVVCGRSYPTMIDADGRRRKFDAVELLFAWLAEPQRWENVAFLPADDRWLREELLDIPLCDEAGRRLRFVSPATLRANPGFVGYWTDLQRRGGKRRRGLSPFRA